MKEFEHLMSVWQGQPAADKLSVDDVLKQVKKGIRGITNKLYWVIVAMIALIVCSFIVTLFFAFRSHHRYINYPGYHDHLSFIGYQALPYFKQTRSYP
jgi:heme/copper-type cytochrome/quinol oxidase subunit 2